MKNITASYVTDSWWNEIDEIHADTITSGEVNQKTRELLQIKWNEKKPSVISFKPTIHDISEYKSLTMDVLVDPSDSDNQNVLYQIYEVRLVDKEGNTATVVLPDKLNVLSVESGELERTEIFDEEIFYWSKTTPLGSLILPIEKFKNIELDKIDSIELVFDQNAKGSILIENIRLQ